MDSTGRSEEGEGPADDVEGIVDPLAPKAGAAGAPGAYDPADPMAAIRMAQEAIANSPLGSGPLGQMGFGKDIQQQLAQAAAQLQANDQALAQLGGIAGVTAAAGAAGAASPAAGADPISLIERLAALRDSGALTDEEFAAQKRRILSGG